jgi:hypothetical protein
VKRGDGEQLRELLRVQWRLAVFEHHLVNLGTISLESTAIVSRAVHR